MLEIIYNTLFLILIGYLVLKNSSKYIVYEMLSDSHKTSDHNTHVSIIVLKDHISDKN